MSSENIPTSELEAWLPHRPPMVWIDEVGETSDSGGNCYVTLKANGLYLTDGSLRATSLIEFLAQGFGFVAAAHKIRLGADSPTALSKAFLVAVTQCELADTFDVSAGARLEIKISDVKSVGPIQIFKGQVSTAAGRTLCTASLKVFSE